VSFRGTFDHTLDAKNRLTVPARYRDALAPGAVLAMPIDQTPCVCVWRAEEYETYTQEALADLPPLSKARNDLARFLYGNSAEVRPDAANRVMIPGFLAEHASLDKDVLVVGAGSWLELWNTESWKGHQPTLRDTVAEVTARADDAA